MPYKLVFSDLAKAGISRLKKSEPKVFVKLSSLLHELSSNPRQGRGKPKALTGDLRPYWSRRISHKHRLVYHIQDDIVEIYIVSTYGHYSDK